MRILCDRPELSDALGLAATVIPARSPRPVLQSVCVRTTKEGIEVLATDLEVSLRAKVGRVDVERPGEALIPAAKATAILRELEGDKVEISCEDRVTTIASGGSKFKIIGEDPKEFPQVPSWDGGGSAEGGGEAAANGSGVLRFGRTQLEAMIRKTSFAAATEGTRYALNGVLFDLSGDRLRLVATDGKRLAVCERPVEYPAGAPVHVVVPNKGVALLSRLGGPDDETIALKLSEGQMLAASSRATISAQLVQGHFPPYDGVIPRDVPHKIEFEGKTFLPALRRAALLTTKESQAVRLVFGFNQLTLSSRTPEVGESEVELPVPYTGDPIEIGFNPIFLMDALKALDGDRFTLEVKDGASPGVIREGESFTYVIMPISLA